ncbi:dephospho-CoA kinase [Defluviitalea raffinosedens]|jgi:dephospho-CoA kinase|uniref:Dephospho-CoA kinase n=1 Tax=Defluviitalea raffinosedens TaxID=1450156 RepID=A0A7C8LGI4_9FIRM|nr:dephospho-CoA kinase [Defluviitalea raffinosedens]KAE9636899.1 dephospho-CoA kinase [Defluviitalea raffinosedens]MBM7686423.1 dephospho-CoA kinase [Defluviitalea raffinosedens]MBZ4667836.1 dephospho-CoA kinase [Defluviitaleaceae bacterium]HHW67209.1 dephospho-CoA kinase [Candidatus Epulonipiscium sp.]
MKIIGLTGGTGSGKSTVVLLLSQLTKAYIIDADKIGHQIILKGQPAYYDIIQHFGREILKEDGEINRKCLGKIVFSDKNSLKILNQITHPRIKEEILKKIEQIKKSYSSYNYIVIDAALLIEAQLHKIVDEVWVVYAEEEKRIQRIMKRDGLNMEQAANRIKAQMPWEEMKKYADQIIDNGKDEEFTLKQLKCIVSKDINF